MRKQPYPVAQLTGGLDVSVDAVFLVDKNSPNLRNVRFDKGLIKKGVGFTQFGTGLPLEGTPMLIDTFPMENGTLHNLIVTTDWVYRYISTSNSYEKKNPSGQFTGDEDNQFSSVVTGKVVPDNGGFIWQDLFILTNGKDKIQKWVGTTANFADLGGWSVIPTLAKSLVVFQSRLIAGFTIEAGVICPRRVRWSIAGDPEDITGTGYGFVDLAETSDWIVALTILKNKLYIFKERSIWELPYVGGVDVFGPPVLKISGVGTLSPLSIVNLGEELIFYGTDNIYIYDGIDLIPIGKNIYPLLYEADKRIVNASKANRVPSAYIEELKSYQLCFPKSESTVPDLLAEYSFDTQSWTLRDKQITALGFYTVPGQDRWMDLTGNWNAQTWVWMAKALPAGAPTTLIGTPDGYVYEDDRLHKSTDVMYFETKDWIFSHAQRWSELRIQARGGPYDVSYSLDEGKTWSTSKTLPYSNPTGEFVEYVVWINKTSQKLRAKILTTAEDLDIKWIESYFIPRKRSKTLISS